VIGNDCTTCLPKHWPTQGRQAAQQQDFSHLSPVPNKKTIITFTIFPVSLSLGSVNEINLISLKYEKDKAVFIDRFISVGILLWDTWTIRFFFTGIRPMVTY